MALSRERGQSTRRHPSALPQVTPESRSGRVPTNCGTRASV